MRTSTKHLRPFVAIAVLAALVGFGRSADAKTLIEKWIPKDPYNFPFNIGNIGAKLVAHYRLLVKTDYAELKGWYYVRAHGHKIVEDKDHVIFRIRLQNGKGVFERQIGMYRGQINMRVRIECETGRVRLALKGSAFGQKFTLASLTLRWQGGIGAALPLAQPSNPQPTRRVWIENPNRFQVVYRINGQQFTVQPGRTNYHDQRVFDFEFDYSGRPGYQRRAYRLKPGSRNRFVLVGNQLVDLKYQR